MPDEYDIQRNQPARSVDWQENEIEYMIDQLHSDFPQFDRQTLRTQIEKRANTHKPADGVEKLLDSLRQALGRLT